MGYNKKFLEKVIKKFIFKDENIKYEYPKILYKYRPFDKYTVEMFDNNYLYLSPADNLDDQFDCSLNFDIDEFVNYNEELYLKECKKSLKKYLSKKGPSYIKPYINEMFDYTDNYGFIDKIKFNKFLKNNNLKIDDNKYFDLIEIINQKIDELKNNKEFQNNLEILMKSILNLKSKTGVCSLTQNKNSQIMWQIYASNYTGYCVEYEILENIYLNKKDVLLPVVYKNKNDFDPVKLVISLLLMKVFYPNDDKLVYYEFISSIYKVLVTKHKEWSFQQEWRLVGDKDYKDYSSLIAKKIYLGKNISDLNKIAILEVAKRNNLEVYIQKDDKVNLTFKYEKLI